MNANRLFRWFLLLFVFLSSGTTANAQRSVGDLLPLQDFLELWTAADPQPDASQSPCYEKQVDDFHAQLNLQKSLLVSFIIDVVGTLDDAPYQIPERKEFEELDLDTDSQIRDIVSSYKSAGALNAEPYKGYISTERALRSVIQKYQKGLEVVLRLRLAGIRIEGMHLIVEANGYAQTFLFQRSIDLAKWETLSEHTIKENNLRIPLDKSSKAAFFRIVPTVRSEGLD